MTWRLLKLAVVGHTNTGKTSLMRTLLRDVDFGEVSSRPAVTRHVEAAELLIDGTPAIELFDTPGLEDSSGLRAILDVSRASSFDDGPHIIQTFLASNAALKEYAQEAKAIRQVLASDVALYVIDARDPVLGRHKDELAILSMCGKPVVPTLNFVADSSARTSEWRAALARVNMHAIAEFDTTIVDPRSEARLFEKVRTLADSFSETIDTFIRDRERLRDHLITASSRLIAELVVNIAAYEETVRSADISSFNLQQEHMKNRIRQREQACVADLLFLHKFRDDDCLAADLPISQGKWRSDLFSKAALKEYGIRTGRAAATGAAIGLTLDLVTAGLSLGTATAIGAAAGAAWETGREHGRRILHRVRGWRTLRCDDATLRLLLERQLWLLQQLLRRGHASTQPTDMKRVRSGRVNSSDWSRHWQLARIKPTWSTLSSRANQSAVDSARNEAVTSMAAAIALATQRDLDGQV